MTLKVDGSTLGFSIHQVDRVTLAHDVIPVPEADPAHLGLIPQDDSFVPVLSLRPRRRRPEEMVVIVKVRGQPVGLPVDDVGRIYSSWTPAEANDAPPPLPGARAASAGGRSFWWVDCDELWPSADAGAHAEAEHSPQQGAK